MNYLAVNGKVQTQSYTYFLYENAQGKQQEIPAYCVNPNQYGVPQTVPEGESIRYLAEEKASDPKVVGLIANMYPHRSLEELGLDNKYQAFYAGKDCLWCYLIPSGDINDVTVFGLTGSERTIGKYRMPPSRSTRRHPVDQRGGAQLTVSQTGSRPTPSPLTEKHIASGCLPPPRIPGWTGIVNISFQDPMTVP